MACLVSQSWLKHKKSLEKQGKSILDLKVPAPKPFIKNKEIERMKENKPMDIMSDPIKLQYFCMIFDMLTEAYEICEDLKQEQFFEAESVAEFNMIMNLLKRIREKALEKEAVLVRRDD